MNHYELENHLLNIEIQEYFNQLEPQNRQILILYYWWGYPDKEIGEILGLSQQVVNYRRKKAIKKIKYQIIQSNN